MASLAPAAPHARIRAREEEFLRASAAFSDLFVEDAKQRGISVRRKATWVHDWVRNSGNSGDGEGSSQSVSAGGRTRGEEGGEEQEEQEEEKRGQEENGEEEEEKGEEENEENDEEEETVMAGALSVGALSAAAEGEVSADSADATTAATTAVGKAGGELPVAYEWLITRLCSPMCPFEDVRGAFRDTAVGLQTTAAMRRQTVSRFCSVPLHPVARMLAADADRRAQRAAAKLARRAVVNPAAVVTGNEEGAGRDEEGSDRKELSPGDTLGLESLRVSATGAVAADPAATSVDSLVTAAAATTSAPTSPPAQHDDLLLSASDSDSDGEDAPTCTFLVQERVRQFVKSCKNGYPGAAWTKLDAMFGMHPRYFESELTTYRRLMTESGPLPATWRHYIAIMAASRYNCHYLVYAGRRRFLATGGDSDWLEGLHRAPPKLARLADLNGVLAHRPWLLGAEESNGAPTGEIVYRNEVAALLSGKNSYSKNELAHAIAVLATYHAQASFCHAMGIEMEPEDEFDVRGCGDAGLIRTVSNDKIGVSVPLTVRLNSATTVGRLGMILPGPVGEAVGGAQALPDFFKKWALIIRDMPDDEEKEHACAGLCAVLKAHAQAAVADQQTLGFVAHAFLSWDAAALQQSNPGLAQEFRTVLVGFSTNLGPQAWQALTNGWPQDLKAQVQGNFGV